jgi:hypothetical protein
LLKFNSEGPSDSIAPREKKITRAKLDLAKRVIPTNKEVTMVEEYTQHPKKISEIF